jgi:hypothetical protein
VPPGVMKMSEQQKPEQGKPKLEPGVCIPWEVKRAEFPQILGDEGLVRRVWEEVDAWGYVYIWQCLLSF